MEEVVLNYLAQKLRVFYLIWWILIYRICLYLSLLGEQVLKKVNLFQDDYIGIFLLMKNTQNVMDSKDLQRKARERINNSYQINRNNPLPFLENKRKGIDSYINERKLKKINLQKEKKQPNQLDNSLSKTTQKDIYISNSQKNSEPKQQEYKKYDEIYRHILDVYNNSNSNEPKRRVIMSPNKVFPHQKIFYGLQPFRKQIQKMRIQNYLATNGEICSQTKISPFSSAIKQLGIFNQYDSKDKNKMIPFKSTQNTASMHRGSSRKNRQQKLKPLSQTNLKKDQTDFLNVQRIHLLQGESKLIQQVSATKHQCSNNHKITEQDFFSNQDQIHKQIKNKPQLSSKPQAIIRNKQRLQQTFKFAPKTKIKKKISGSKYNVVVLSDNQKSKLKLANSSQLIRITSQLQERHQLTQLEQDIPEQQKQGIPKQSFQPKLRKKKFQIPFQTYYYRDLIWKMNFSNELFIETPVEYQHRLKVFLGRGNNSSMVGGLIKRRIWFATTDRIQQANFVWTQLKSLPFFKKQEKNQGQQLISNNQLKYIEKSVLTDKDKKIISSYMETYVNFQQRGDQKFLNRQKMIKYQKTIKISEIKQIRMQNHLINNYVIGNKKALFQTMTNYYNSIGQDVFNYLPLTFHIKNGLQDQSYFQFLKYFYKRAKQIKANTDVPQKKRQHNAWIVKPGQNSNRGQGIQVCLNLQEIKQILKKKGKYSDGSQKTYIVQSYIQKPLLYQRRKFDLRHYLMITCVNRKIKGYWYKDGYVRTTSSQYNLKTNCGKIHLTNDAVQKNLPDYGKYQKGNKISYQDLHTYMQTKYKDFDFYQKIYPKMKKVATDIVRACSASIDPQKLANNFQIYGLDFMIDSSFNVWLIQVNSNPCLQLSCPLLGCIIPKMIENALQLTLDCMFPPPVRYTPKGMHYYKNLQQQNRFQLVYDQRIQGLSKCNMDVLDPKMLYEQDDTFQDDGEQWNQD